QKFQYHAGRQELRSHLTKQFVFEPISSPSADVDSRCRATRSPIGLKPSDSSSSRLAVVESMKRGTFDSRSGDLQSAESKAVNDLAQALRERVAIIRDEESRRDEAKHIARLRAVSEKIDKLQATLPQPIDPRLAHYLQRKSYDKALAHLEGGDD